MGWLAAGGSTVPKVAEEAGVGAATVRLWLKMARLRRELGLGED